MRVFPGKLCNSREVIMPPFEGTRPHTLRDYQPVKRHRRKRHSADFEDFLIATPAQPHAPEEALWRAVITQVMTDALSYSDKAETAQERREAIDWLCGMSRDFRVTCCHAGLNYAWVHRRIHHFLNLHMCAHPQWPGVQELVAARLRYRRNKEAVRSWEQAAVLSAEQCCDA
jgi:hypothetical protein